MIMKKIIKKNENNIKNINNIDIFFNLTKFMSDDLKQKIFKCCNDILYKTPNLNKYDIELFDHAKCVLLEVNPVIAKNAFIKWFTFY